MASRKASLTDVQLLQETRELQQKLQHERERLLDLNINKMEFVSRMNHELRTPLHVIMSYAQLLRMDTSLNEEHQEDIERIYQAGCQMLAVINDLIDLSKMEISGVGSLHLEWFDLAPILCDVLDCHKKMAIAFQLKMEVAVPPIGGQQIHGDLVHFKQIVMNLVSNAIKFTDAFGIVILRVMEYGHALIIEVEDNGCGIPLDRIDDIFNPFNDVAATYPFHIRRRSCTIRSSGLGLSLSKRMADLMDMQICVKSSTNSGSRFSILVPARLTRIV